jgi:FAD:protein FMN transferase
MKRSISRRQFLNIIAASTTAGVALKLGIDRLNDPVTLREMRLLMGTVVNLTVIGEDERSMQAALRACLDGMSGLEAVLSRFQPQSQLCRLNRLGELTHPHPSLRVLIEQSLELSHISAGAFDITVKPLVDLYQSCQATGKGLPEAEEVRQKRTLVDYHRIALKGDQIQLKVPGMSITLDAIAKGYIVDVGVSLLKQAGFSNVLVEAGGDLMACGEKDLGSPWQIGIQSPRSNQPRFLGRLSVKDRAVATSGDYVQAFVSDYSANHILDPSTGYSPSQIASVTVIAPTAVLADGLATTLMVAGCQDGPKILRQFNDCQAYLATKDLQLVRI